MIRSLAAAHARTAGSSASFSLISCVRCRSNDGWRKNNPRTISPLKFSSLNRCRHGSESPILLARKQAGPQICRIALAGLYALTGLCGLFLACGEICFNLISMPQVVGDGCIGVGQGEAGVLLDNGLWSRAILEGMDHQFH